jgi:Domain of unknown function (DUF2828)
MTAQIPKESVFTEVFHRRPVDPGLVRQALGAFEKEVVALAFYWLGLGNRGGYIAIMREVLKGFPRLADNPLRRVPIEGTWRDLWELYGISEAGDKAIDSVVLGHFMEDQESEKPSQFVRWLPVDLKNPLTRRFARLFFPFTLASKQIRRYRGAVSCLKLFCVAAPAAEPEPAAQAVPGERIFSSAMADKLLAPVFLTMARKYDMNCVTPHVLPEDTVFMCDFSESMWGRPLAISLTLGIISGRVLTFDTEPRWHIFTTEDTLQKKILSTRYISHSSQTDYNIAYDLILKEVVCGKMSVPRFLIVITDMDYKDTSACVFNIKGVREAFSKEGYEAPILIIWNVSTAFRGPHAVLCEEGVAEMRGWSDSMLNMLKGGVRVITPMELVQNYDLNII